MPIVFKRSVGSSTLTLWRIEESEEQLQKLVTGGDRDSSERFSTLNRRLQHLASRAIIRGFDPNSIITYSNEGAPIISSGSFRIGVAHTQEMVALIANSNSPCAVDIESTTRSFTAASKRYISTTEQRLSDASHPLFEVAMWCAKETMYKYTGRKELDLLEDIKILELDIEAARIIGEVRVGRGSREGAEATASGSGEESMRDGEAKPKDRASDQKKALNNTIKIEMGVVYYEQYIIVYTL